MIDMKIDYAAKEKSMLGSDCQTAEDHRPKYPYGLELHLNSESLKKLGIGPNQFPKVGGEMMLHATVKVESVGASESAGSEGPDAHMTLQITALELEGGEKPNLATRLYGGE
ncbi:MAG: hypothetical protein C0422_09845 [Alcaligenaceae bacterium]|nr:hypothetical protein [Alcaligenaceae bacterium]